MAVICSASCMSVAELVMVQGGEEDPGPRPPASRPGGCGEGPPQEPPAGLPVFPGPSPTPPGPEPAFPGDADAVGQVWGTPREALLPSSASHANRPGALWTAHAHSSPRRVAGTRCLFFGLLSTSSLRMETGEGETLPTWILRCSKQQPAGQRPQNPEGSGRPRRRAAPARMSRLQALGSS